MAEPVAIRIYIYEDGEVAVNMKSEAEKVESGSETYWKGGRALEIRTHGSGGETHVMAALKDAYRRFAEL